MRINNDNYQLRENDLYNMYACESAVDQEAIIYCHGGAFRYGNKEDDRDFLVALTNKMSMRVYSIGYRNLDEARTIMNMIDDINNSINSIVINESISQFHIIGSSSGAYLAWILSIMASNSSMFNISVDYDVLTTTLISGYLLFKENDPITRMLCLFPAFQSFPQNIKNINMDYSIYNLPRLLLITGDEDSCQEDSRVLNEAVRRSNSTEVLMSVITTDVDKADHSFLIKNPTARISERTFECMRSFIKR